LFVATVSNVALYYEFHQSFQLWSNYWHFVDSLWFCVFSSF
jgi:heme/copper-type cytochrome/quinol oxidase subunit 3